MEIKIYLISLLVYLPSLTFAADCEYGKGMWKLKKEKVRVENTDKCKEFCEDVKSVKGNKLYCIFWQLDNNGWCHTHLVTSYKSWYHTYYGEDFSTFGINFCRQINDNNQKPRDNAPSCKEYKGTGKLETIKHYGVESKEDCKLNCKVHCLVWEYNTKKECKLTHLKEEKHYGGSYGIFYCSQGNQQTENTCRCGIPNEGLSRIMGGMDAPKHKYPWQVFIHAYSPNGKYKTCGGTLISDSSILTAAHCLYFGEFKADPVKVWIDIYDITLDMHLGGSIDVNVFKPFGDQPIANPSGGIVDDIAIITIDQPINFKEISNIRPICLPEGGKDFSGFVYENQVTHILGWGMMRPEGPFSPWLQEVSVDTISNEICGKNMHRSLKDKEMCSRGVRRTHLEGDSGGPYMIQNKLSEQYVQTGIVKQGTYTDHKRTTYGIATRTSSYLEWIKKNWLWKWKKCI